MKYYLAVLKNYAGFTGRIRRSEYWYFVLFNMIFAFVAMGLDNLLGITFKINGLYGAQSLPYGYMYLFYALAMFIPGLAVVVRRLHDVGKSGWFLLIALIPIAGWIWIPVLLFTDSNNGPNRFGPNPKGIGNYDEIDEIGNYLAK